MEKIQIVFASPRDEAEIKSLLENCELPHEDITADDLQHFLIIRDQEVIAGVVGLEIYTSSALMRSLAVDPEYRGEVYATRLVKKPKIL